MGTRLVEGRQMWTRLADLSLWCKSSSIEEKLPHCQVSFPHTNTSQGGQGSGLRGAVLTWPDVVLNRVLSIVHTLRSVVCISLAPSVKGAGRWPVPQDGVKGVITLFTSGLCCATQDSRVKSPAGDVR